jgi:hypothetical protein
MWAIRLSLSGGRQQRAGLYRMLAELHLTKGGTVRLMRSRACPANSRDWQQAIEICRVVDTSLMTGAERSKPHFGHWPAMTRIEMGPMRNEFLGKSRRARCYCAGRLRTAFFTHDRMGAARGAPAERMPYVLAYRVTQDCRTGAML